MDDRVRRLSAVADIAQGRATAALADHRARVRDVENRIAALRQEADPAAPDAYTAFGGHAARAAWRHRQLCLMNVTLADLRSRAEGIERAAALATARAEVARRLLEDRK